MKNMMILEIILIVLTFLLHPDICRDAAYYLHELVLLLSRR